MQPALIYTAYQGGFFINQKTRKLNSGLDPHLLHIFLTVTSALALSYRFSKGDPSEIISFLTHRVNPPKSLDLK